MCVGVSVCMGYVCVRERESVCERERESVCECVYCMSMHLGVCVFVLMDDWVEPKC